MCPEWHLRPISGMKLQFWFKDSVTVKESRSGGADATRNEPVA